MTAKGFFRGRDCGAAPVLCSRRNAKPDAQNADAGYAPPSKADRRRNGAREETAMATHLSLEEMKQFVRRQFDEFVNRQNPDVIRQTLTADFHDHDGPGGKASGVEGDRAMMMAMYERMPDLQVTIEDMIAEGDKVMCRNVWRWTDVATKKRMQFRGFVLWRFDGDRIAERWATVTSAAEATERW
jgi:predicted ester cyclase